MPGMPGCDMPELQFELPCLAGRAGTDGAMRVPPHDTVLQLVSAPL